MASESSPPPEPPDPPEPPEEPDPLSPPDTWSSPPPPPEPLPELPEPPSELPELPDVPPWSSLPEDVEEDPEPELPELQDGSFRCSGSAHRSPPPADGRRVEARRDAVRGERERQRKDDADDGHGPELELSHTPTVSGVEAEAGNEIVKER